METRTRFGFTTEFDAYPSCNREDCGGLTFTGRAWVITEKDSEPESTTDIAYFAAACPSSSRRISSISLFSSGSAVRGCRSPA
jgi:hypothetical protein